MKMETEKGTEMKMEKSTEMKTIGIIGGGQLGLMIAEQAHVLGVRALALDPAPDAPAFRVCDGHIVAAYDDAAALEELCRRSDVVTYEFENVPGDILIPLCEKYNIPQGYRPLYDSQDRLREKTNARDHGLQTPGFAAVDDEASLRAAVRELGLPAVLKTRTLGYDGHGQAVLRCEADIEKAVAGVMEIETQLAEKSWSNVELRNIPAMYNPMSKADFEKAYDAIDWATYYREMGIGDFDTIIVTTPSAVANANEVLKKAPLENIRYYLAAQYIDAAASYLSDDFIDASFDFYGRTMSGTQEQKPRWKRAMSVPNSTLSEAVGEMYVAKYFPAKDKERMLALVKNLQTALSQHIDALDWMSDATKAKAQEKLAAFTVKIGYPDTWKDYSTLEIDPLKSYWENIVEANRWYTADNIAELNKPVDRAKWQMSPQTVNAYYNPTTNEICFPAAILQPPFYNPDADDAVNYGAIGVVIGHEMTHGFDDQGRNFDKDGNMNNWWTDEDAAAFKAKTDILVKQFDAIEVLPARDGQPALHANGALSLGENIADQGGLRVAWTAYQNSLEGKQAPAPIDGFTDAQRFYLAYATLWAQNIRDEEIARLTKLDVHSLGKWRVNATLRNLESFYEAFGITDGAMFMPAEERVIIW